MSERTERTEYARDKNGERIEELENALLDLIRIIELDGMVGTHEENMDPMFQIAAQEKALQNAKKLLGIDPQASV